MKKILLTPLAICGLLAAAHAQTPKPNTVPPSQTVPPTEQGAGIAHVGKDVPVAAYYEGGQEAMYAFIAKELKYPLMAKRNRMQGRCIVSFTLNPDGTMQGLRIVKQVGGGTGEEAARVVRLLKFKKPEYPILTSLPIDFKLGVTGSNALEN
ncbi:energy transducer TonB [Hymenobacter sp. H14-R3]|uniref:energy transducer TonB n=1 Tax=Hymenobacter sp. H14-R3 TaxID=3046308 RepID=UPI0024BB811B|nr:energy transducer TonB [Hymenobacter sp. H14-R3]MDJ0365955.1 energy transducer TonB [Hymenobacter sp. H14-R3]